MSQRDDIAEQALKLAPNDRAYVAELFEQSLPTGGFVSAEIADAWSKEIDRRIAAYDRGDTEAISVETSLQHACDALTRQRSEAASQ